MITSVFTYGSLMFPEVMFALTEKEFSFQDTALQGFSRYQVKDKPYPGVVESPEGITAGRLYFALDEQSLWILDRFEDTLYTRKTVHVKTENSNLVDAFLYVVPDSNRHLLYSEPWDPERFRREVLIDYIGRCERFRASLNLAA